jgi:hypothetical protein
MSDLQYTDRPKDQNPGVCFLCMCSKDEQSPTHMLNGLNSIFWCKRCGRFLGLHDMDIYFHSAQYSIEQAKRKQREGAPH